MEAQILILNIISVRLLLLDQMINDHLKHTSISGACAAVILEKILYGYQ